MMNTFYLFKQHHSDDTMKGCKIVLYYFVILTLNEFVWCDKASNTDFTVRSTYGEITLLCGENNKVTKDDKNVTFPLKYKDESTGEYQCVDRTGKQRQKIYVKFRTCENCVELDLVSISGLAVGDLMATIVLGVAVYLVASHTHAFVATSRHKRSDREHLISNETQRRVPNEGYQELKYKDGRREIYHTLSDK
ncbi:T-cell surface glycoprotein CD3 delta chain-like isoform X2 [Corythoichthys intestinalis]|uniref:T-cell surface glycoprotein CD3 delta chain-like isoform X2 n=1 Tax=Corythoichthys intestinalis TaxID=161448 RepID=UPI0025A61825|nr:T-cell surface glycoprotein CD3 delta chain-like isoform X2 [Corythoichthys intestinalis]